MRKFLAALALLIVISPIAVDARTIRSHSTRSYINRQNSVVRTRWQRPASRDTWRYFPTYSKYDLLRWRNYSYSSQLSTDTEPIYSPRYLSSVFCSYEGSRIGEYLTQDEVDNRCCTCDDGWQCVYSALAQRDSDTCE